jgi:hypothetical protein
MKYGRNTGRIANNYGWQWQRHTRYCESLELEQAYRCAGLSLEAAIDRFKLVLDRSYGYTSSKADAISLKNIRKRLECTYKKNEAPKVYKPSSL